MREKTLSEYTDVEHRQSTFNAKVMNGIIHSMSNEEAYRVSSFNTAYDIWEALRVAYEGDDSVKE